MVNNMLTVTVVLFMYLKFFTNHKLCTSLRWFLMQVGQYVGELCRYLLNTPPRPEETQHKVWTFLLSYVFDDPSSGEASNQV